MQHRIDALEGRVGALESANDKHDKALFGFYDTNGVWNDGLVQHVSDIRKFSGVAVSLLGKAVPAIWTGVIGLILFLLRAAWVDFVAPHLHGPHG